MKKLNLITKDEGPGGIDIYEENINMEYFENINNENLQIATNCRIGISKNGEFANKALYLDSYYDYILGKDSIGLTILVPFKKKRLNK